MKKLLVKLLLVVTVLLTVPYYFLGGSLPLPGILQNLFSEAPAKKEPLNTSTVRTDRDVTVYKWVDAKGQTHFGEIPPVGEVTETLELKTDTNVMKSIKTAEPEQEGINVGGRIITLGKSSGSGSDSDNEEVANDSVGGLENPYSPEGVKNLFENAKCQRYDE